MTTIARRVDAALSTFAEIVLQGNDLTLMCHASQNPFPAWTGPNNNGIITFYNYEGSPEINGNLGEKSNRLTWAAQHNTSLIIKSVVNHDSGMYTCYKGKEILQTSTVLVIVHPQKPVISNKESLNDFRIVVRGKEDQPSEKTCTSTGGYPKPNLKWYRGNNQTTSLISDETSEINSDGNYIVVQKYKFTPTRQDDRVSYLCQSSFDLAQPYYQSDRVLLYLNLKPSYPSVTSNTVTENVVSKVAECTTSQFRPHTIQVWLQKQGNNVSSEITLIENDTTETYTLTTSYSDSLSRESNGKYLVCHISHDTLQTPLKGSAVIDVNFRPLTVKLTGDTSKIVANNANTISITCTSGTSNPKSIIQWFRNNQEETSNANILEADGEYNGAVTSQILRFVPDRTMDGQEVYCTVHNSVNEQTPIESPKKIIDLLYHPVVYLTYGGEVTEGQDKILQCGADAKPNPSFTWYHNEHKINSNVVGSGESSMLILHNVNRTNAGQYKCVADNGYKPDGVNLTAVLVKYTPDVVVTTRNVTVIDSTAELICTANGVPSLYTFSEWQHTWPGYGSIKHFVDLGKNPTLTLTSLTYEYSGEYTCTVSNGVSGSLNPYAGYGKAYLNIETWSGPLRVIYCDNIAYPIITTLSSKKVSAQLNMNTSTIIQFYSNRNDNKVDCYRGERKHDCSYAIHTGTIHLPVFDSVIYTEGLAATITFTIKHKDHYGAVKVIISNGIGEAPIYITVVPEGPPEIPHFIEFSDISSTSVTISWIPGFSCGFEQTFLIQYGTHPDTWDQCINVTLNGGENEGLLNTTLTGLQSGTRHYLRLLAYNLKGNSKFTDVYNYSTESQETDESVVSPPAVKEGVLGSIATLALVVAAVLVIVFRRQQHKHTTDTIEYEMPQSRTISSENDREYNTQHTGRIQIDSHVYSDSNTYYNIDRTPYEDLKPEHEDTHEYGTINMSDENVRRKERDKQPETVGYEIPHSRTDSSENGNGINTMNTVRQTASDHNSYYNLDRSPYEDLTQERVEIHEYGTLNISEDNPKLSTDKLYENLRLSPMK